ncbi:elongator complex protein 5 isoform X3 [Taeniopygia guttata]|uniref:elongator complex protein 5 isoform X3 n=1 Tax=Taeniopygia guttata TaxID=59729 RepID=UPI003BB92FCD
MAAPRLGRTLVIFSLFSAFFFLLCRFLVKTGEFEAKPTRGHQNPPKKTPKNPKTPQIPLYPTWRCAKPYDDIIYATVTSSRRSRFRHGGSHFRTTVSRGETAAAISLRDVIGKRRATMLEALRGGGLLLVRDSAGSEGRSLLRAIASEAVARDEEVLVVLLEVPREQFQEGLSPHVRERLHFQDLFGDPLGWLGRAPPGLGGIFGGVLGGLPSPAPLLLLDSLSWALLREPLPHLCRRLGALLGGAPRKEPPPRIVALLHQDLHPPHILGALGGLARAQLILGGPPETPGAPRRLRLLRDPQKTGGPLQERPRSGPRGLRGPRRGPGAVTPPGNPNFGGKIPKFGTPIKELLLPHPPDVVLRQNPEFWGKKSQFGGGKSPNF